MKGLVTTLDKRHDLYTFEHVQRVVASYPKHGFKLDRGTKIEYIRHLRHQRKWSFELIGRALGISSRTASKLLRSWQDETFGPI